MILVKSTSVQIVNICPLVNQPQGLFCSHTHLHSILRDFHVRTKTARCELKIDLKREALKIRSLWVRWTNGSIPVSSRFAPIAAQVWIRLTIKCEFWLWPCTCICIVKNTSQRLVSSIYISDRCHILGLQTLCDNYRLSFWVFFFFFGFVLWFGVWEKHKLSNWGLALSVLVFTFFLSSIYRLFFLIQRDFVSHKFSFLVML